VGFPLALLFGFALKWEGLGVWIGLAASLALAASLLTARFLQMSAAKNRL
jgi:MATE family multidrug resistance protein